MLDRHYNSLKPYRKGEPNIYAVLKNGNCTIKYVEVTGNHLILRPHNQAHSVEVIALQGRKAAHYLIGRVCQVGMEI